jgi:hypothetical protein
MKIQFHVIFVKFIGNMIAQIKEFEDELFKLIEKFVPLLGLKTYKTNSNKWLSITNHVDMEICFIYQATSSPDMYFVWEKLDTEEYTFEIEIIKNKVKEYNDKKVV